jgi:hypothetical protein
MAFQTGSQINPALGAINYTPYMQGAVAGAQSIGQGIANLGQSFATGIEKYYQKKEENELLDNVTNNVAKRFEGNPELAKRFGVRLDENGKPDIKGIRYTVKAGGAANFLNALNALDANLTAEESAARVSQATLNELNDAMRNEGLANAGAGELAGPVYRSAPVPKLTAVEQLTANENLLKFQLAQAGLGKTLAETGAVGASRKRGGYVKQAEAQAEANKMAASAGPGFAGVTKYDPLSELYLPDVTQVTKPNVVEPYKKAADEARFARDQSIVESATNAVGEIETADRIISSVDSGKVNTGLAATFNQFKDKVFAALGNKGAAADASATELLEAAQGQLFLDQRAKENITSTMLNTANELNVYRNIFAGTKEMEPASIKKLAMLKRAIAVASIESHNRAVDRGSLTEYYGSVNREKPEPIKIPTYNPAVSLAPPPDSALSFDPADLAARAAAEIRRRNSQGQ